MRRLLQRPDHGLQAGPVVTMTPLTLAAMGLAVFPVDHPSLPACAGWHNPDAPCDGHRGKHPACRWSRQSSTDRATITHRFGHHPRNIGIDCGRSRLVVLDEDEPGELDRLCADHGQTLPVTFTVTTGKGRHMYLRQPGELPYGNSPGALRDYRIDVRGRGGYVVGPGSTHATGRVYRLEVAAPIAPVPAWIDLLLRPAASVAATVPAQITSPGSKPALAGLLRVVLDAQPGGRNNALNWAAFRMWQKVRDGYVDAPAAEGMLLDAATVAGLSDSEAHATIGSARRAVLND